MNTAQALTTELQKRLLSIHNVAAGLKQLTAARAQSLSRKPPPRTGTSTIPPLDLPPVDDSLISAWTSSLPEQHAATVAQKVRHWLSRSQQVVLTQYQKTCQTLISNNHAPPDELSETLGRVKTSFQMAYQRDFATKLTERLSSMCCSFNNSNAASRDSQDRKRPFNHEYTPLLETYFSYNAYPSAPDRAVLARKSMMSPRQIEIWFQNHRRRAKQSGKPLKRLTSDPLPLKLSLRSIEENMGMFTIPEHERQRDYSSCSDREHQNIPLSPARNLNETQPISFNDPLDVPAAAHSFPKTYTQSKELHAFPLALSEFRFPPPAWPRKSTPHRPPATEIDMDHFITDFQVKLKIRHGGTGSQISSRHCDSPWNSSTVTRLPRSTHPALNTSSNAPPLIETLLAISVYKIVIP